MILDKHEWLCASERLNDFPVICWTDFEGQGCDTLHTAVKCKLNYYHFAASKIRDQVLELMQKELELRLQHVTPAS